jgi:DNA-binding GntR family transcriptional regulator
MNQMNILAEKKVEKNGDQKIAEYAAQLIRKKILDGLLSPGQRLIESELMSELDIGRSTIREAYLKLDAEGFVELRHQRGAVVKRMTRRDMAELFSIREQLEGMAAACAAANIDHGQNRSWLQAARALWEEETVATNEFRHMEENVPFHDGIIAMSENQRLAKMLQPLQIPGYRIQFLKLLDRKFCEATAAEHIRIADAILAGDVSLAEARMREHVRRAGDLAQLIPGLE